ncbi:hypothetical protein [Demequina aestuarii]|nr:hypothetical protein [Demequina aestuarii]
MEASFTEDNRAQGRGIPPEPAPDRARQPATLTVRRARDGDVTGSTYP